MAMEQDSCIGACSYVGTKNADFFLYYRPLVFASLIYKAILYAPSAQKLKRHEN